MHGQLIEIYFFYTTNSAIEVEAILISLKTRRPLRNILKSQEVLISNLPFKLNILYKTKLQLVLVLTRIHHFRLEIFH